MFLHKKKRFPAIYFKDFLNLFLCRLQFSLKKSLIVLNNFLDNAFAENKSHAQKSRRSGISFSSGFLKFQWIATPSTEITSNPCLRVSSSASPSLFVDRKPFRTGCTCMDVPTQ